MIDLHTHSNVSDGSDAPERIPELAVEAGCSAVALTDHDSLAGIVPARRRAEELGITFVPGCEVSCRSAGPGGMHVLVYFVDDDASPIGEELVRLREDRRRRNLALADRLIDLGLPVTYEMVVAEAGGESGVGRPHFAAALVAVGAADSVDDAFDRYLANRRPGLRAQGSPDGGRGGRAGRASGGVAVLAHPYSMGLEGRDLARVVGGAGRSRVRRHRGRLRPLLPPPAPELGNLARRFDLVATGGSDHHGLIKPDLRVGTGQGDLKVPDRVVGELEARRPDA